MTGNRNLTGIYLKTCLIFKVVIDDKTKKEELEGERQQPNQQTEKPTIIIDAGQESGVTAVKFALFIIEQLVACQENKDMIQDVKWVIIPSANPDGLEYSKYVSEFRF